jgi:hemerythrin
MDKEHQACAAALGDLSTSLSAEALRAVLAAYQKHFAHEEQLLDKHLYADVSATSSAGFSAAEGQRRSHFADHQRLLADIEKQLVLAEASGRVPMQFVRRVTKDFEVHATTYDDSYADPLSRLMAAASA